MSITGTGDIHPLLALWGVGDSLSRKPSASNYLSPSRLNKPKKEEWLRRDCIAKGLPLRTRSISSLLSARIGSAIHADIANLLTNPKLKQQIYNIPDINRFMAYKIVNNEILVEQNGSRELGHGFTVRGTYDAVFANQVIDFKTVTLSSHQKADPLKFQMQMSAYKYMHPELITNPIGLILSIIREYRELDTPREGYPLSAYQSLEVPLFTEQEFKDRALDFALYVTDKTKSEDTLVSCTQEERWQKPDVYEVYTKATNKTAKAKFDTKEEAHEYIFVEKEKAALPKSKSRIDWNQAIIKKKQQPSTYCERYCEVSEYCTQYQSTLPKEVPNEEKGDIPVLNISDN